MFYFFLFIFLFLCVILSITVLMQDSKSSGLGESFGGDSSNSLFGTSTAEVLKKFTYYLMFFFVLFAIIISLWTSNLAQANQNQIYKEHVGEL